MSGPIYLDHNATTPLDPTAAEAMMPFMSQEFGNPSSPYDLGVRAKDAVERARKEVALLIGCRPREVVFTSGGTESNNAVLKGVIDFKRPGDFHVITSSVEHPAVLNPALYLLEQGVKVDILPVDRFGRVDPEDVRRAIRPQTRLISIMLANNETGTLQPVREIAGTAKEFGVLLHTDAAQAVGKMSVHVDELGVDFLSIAGHKLYGPKGIGALFIREGTALTPLLHGAGQEGGLRPGTENTILAVGLGAACRRAEAHLEDDIAHMMVLRDRLEDLLRENLADLVFNGHPDHRLPNTLNVSAPNIEGSGILEGLPSLLASTGAACHDRTVRLSHVLAAMGVPPEVGMGTLRLTTGRTNTPDQIETAATMIIARIKEMRNGS
ncbi:MAG: cysteine desulfurase family protein [Desulfatiglandales bacterium]